MFVEWYNEGHFHSSIRFVTPADRHTGEDVAILQNRKEIYHHARRANPHRWSGATRNWSRPAVVRLNPPKELPRPEERPA